LLRKALKYFLILLAACVIVFLLFSCTVRKKADAAATDTQPDPSESMKAARFGHLYVDGCADRMKGNLHEALKLFEECRQLDPENLAVHYELGTVYKLLGQHDRALAHARVCADADPSNEWYQLLYIHCLNAKGLYSQSIRAREALVKRFPEKNEFREDLAIEYALTGQFEKSLKIYDELEKTYGINEQLTLNKVKLLKSQGKLKEVENELQRLSASQPGEVRFYAYLAEFYLEQKQPEKAKEMYDRILEADPANGSVNLALHDYYSGRGEPDKAFGYLRKGFESPDLDAATKTAILGSFYQRAESGEKEAARQGTELAAIMLKVHPEVPASNALYGDFLMLEKKVAEAAPYYFRAATAETRDHRVWENLLFVDNELGRYDSLERHSAMAIELFPSQPRNYLYNGLANSRTGNPKKAARALEEGMGYISDDKVLMLDFLRLMGDMYHATGDHARSDKAFEDALKINSDDAYVLNNYAYYLSLRKEQLDRAEKLSKKANQLQPGNRNYMDTYGWILFQQKKFTEAVEWLSAASKIGAPNPTILEHYGDALFRTGRTGEALKQWEAARNAGGASEELIRKIRGKKME
jgi:tetratricopeptide (TPR) repeat protein